MRSYTIIAVSSLIALACVAAGCSSSDPDTSCVSVGTHIATPTGPVLVDFQLVESTSLSRDIEIMMVPPGTYDEIEFEIHKVSDDDPEDEAFLMAHPELEGKSIVVTGTFNGEDFVYETDLNEDQEFAIDLVVGQDETTNVTVQFDVSTWFVDGAGNLFNPATALKGGPNENLAEDNIENSIEAFEDEDEDGHHDDGHHDDD